VPPAVVEHEDPVAARHLVETPAPRADRHVPAAAGAADHLHVVATHVAELARLDDALQLLQWFVEHVVLHHPQHATVALRGGDHCVGFVERVAHRLLEVHVPPGVEHLDDARRT